MTETHLFLGPPGSGKTTVLCKWLAQMVQLGRDSIDVWRLETRTSNHAEFLTIYSELLGLPVQRAWPAEPLGEGLHLIDLPGIGITDRESHDLLKKYLPSLGFPQIHLVLNAAYDAGVLWQQFNAFRHYNVTDLILTHLDEAGPLARLRSLLVELALPIRYMNEDGNVCTQLRRAGELLATPSWQNSCSVQG